MKGMMIVKSFFERLKELRKKAGLTQTELAELVNMHETTIRRWENAKGIPRIEEMKKLAKALNVHIRQGAKSEEHCSRQRLAHDL